MEQAELVRTLIGCMDFAAVKHKDQKRKDTAGTPYINHPVGVARILTEEGHITDPATIQAALLHDTVEDTDTSFEELRTEFGEEVCSLVAEVTDDKALSKAERKRLQIENAPKKSLKAKQVKLADKLYNLRCGLKVRTHLSAAPFDARDLERCTPIGWNEPRVQEYFAWAAQVVRGLQGACPSLEAKLQEIFRKRNVLTE